jgi:hypothetical protein
MEAVVQTLIQAYLQLYGGDVRFIASEFPMKHDENFQSKTIDMILLNTKSKILYLVELKTSEAMFDYCQYIDYHKWKSELNKQLSSSNIWEYLTSKLDLLRKRSSYSKKYEKLQAQIIN